MANNFYLSRLAKADLRRIIVYSRENWGNQQAIHYFQVLDERFQWLADNPKQGKERNDIKPNYRSFHEGRHIIFYKQRGNDIAIARILHERMDFSKHL